MGYNPAYRPKKLEYTCTCGKTYLARPHDVKRGHTKSCGCHKATCRKKHGISNKKNYNRARIFLNLCKKNGTHVSDELDSIGKLAAHLNEKQKKGSLSIKEGATSLTKESLVIGVKPRKANKHPFLGQMMTPKEIAKAMGCCTESVYRRLKKGIPLSDPKRTYKKTKL